MHLPLGIVLGLAAILLAGDLLAGALRHTGTGYAAIAQRVEVLRGQSFGAHLPPLRRITPEAAEEEATQGYEESSTERQEQIDIAMPMRLGLVPKDFDPSEAGTTEAWFDSQIGDVTLVRSENSADQEEAILAHELTHALEDQHFIIDIGAAWFETDLALAQKALTEGTASVVEYEYIDRFMPGRDPYEEADGEEKETELPLYIELQADFPYYAGFQFVQDLRQAADGGWALVDRALKERPPVSTEQVIHPEKYLANEVPLKELEAPRPDDARRVTWGVLGELGTLAVLLGLGAEEDAAGDAAAGWDGDTWSFWLRGKKKRCTAPCADRGVFVFRWRTDTTQDAVELEAEMKRAVRDVEHAALDRRDRVLTLVLAPTTSEARRLSRR